jgi:N-acetylglucosamine kinase-like BadF-type ATPase
VLGHGCAGPGNIHIAGTGPVLQHLQAALEQALQQAGLRPPVPVLCAGLAGMGTPADRVCGIALLEQLECAQFRLEHDARVALAAGVGVGPGIVLVAGTGSMSWGLASDGRQARSGGWGWFAGDEGGALWLVRQALTAAARAADQRGPETVLGTLLSQAAGHANVRDLLAAAASGTTSLQQLAGLAPVVCEAAEQGDEVADALLDQAAQELFDLVVHVMTGLADRQQSALPVVLRGGLLEHDTPVARRFRDLFLTQYPQHRIGPPLVAGEVGAALLALEQAGVILPLDSVSVGIDLGCQDPDNVCGKDEP